MCLGFCVLAALAFADSSDRPSLVRAGESVDISTERVDFGSNVVRQTSVWAFEFEMPAAVRKYRDALFYKEPVYARWVLPFAPEKKGRPEKRYVIDTAGLPAGDYRVNIDCDNVLHPVSFRILSSISKQKVAWNDGQGVRWRLRHDRDRIFFAAEAGPGVPITLFLDPEGKGLNVARLTFLEDGTHRDVRAVDDNTNRGRFALDWLWRSGAKTHVRQVAGGWILLAEVPFGPLPGVEDAGKEWGFNVSTNDAITGARDYPRQQFPEFVGASHALDIIGLKAAATKTPKGLALRARASLRDRSKMFRLLGARFALESADGRLLDEQTQEIGLDPGKTCALTAELGAGKVGVGDAVVLRLTLLNPEGLAEKSDCREMKVEYNPVRISMTEPCYRDNVYETMHLRQIRGVVSVDDGFGGPLEVTLTGPGTSETVRFSTIGSTNEFIFAFANKPKGNYFIRAGNAVKRIRNLPYHKGEIWIDGKGVVRKDGEKMLPFGWYSEVFRAMYPGITVAQRYDNTMRNEAELSALTDPAASHGCGMIVTPLQNLSEVPRAKLFSPLAAQDEFDAAPYAEAREDSVLKFVAMAKDRDGFFGYHLWDEPDGGGRNHGFFKRLHEIVSEADPYHPTIIVTCTYEGAAKFADCCDIICPDKYPVYLQGSGATIGSRSAAFKWAWEASARATSSWFTPQAFDWDYYAPGKTTRGPTYLELREQCLEAFAGNARGILLYSRVSYNPPGYELRTGGELLAEEFLESRDLYLSPSVTDLAATVVPASPDVALALKAYGDERMLIACNASAQKVRFAVRSSQLPAQFFLGGEIAPQMVKGGQFVGELMPYESKVYHSRSKAFSPARGVRRIAAQESARRKPGNLALASSFPTWAELKKMSEGKLNLGYPKVVASSSFNIMNKMPFAYFLQDGIADEFPYLNYHAWKPQPNDGNPTVTVEFGAEKVFRKIVLTCCRDAVGHYPVRKGAVEANGKEIAIFERKDGGVVRLDFAPVRSERVSVRLEGDRASAEGWLAEVEVY